MILRVKLNDVQVCSGCAVLLLVLSLYMVQVIHDPVWWSLPRPQPVVPVGAIMRVNSLLWFLWHAEEEATHITSVCVCVCVCVFPTVWNTYRHLDKITKMNEYN